jgi:hypothetical protein
MSIFPFSHETLMNLNIFLAGVHILLSSVMLILVLNNVKLPSYVLPGFLFISIVACILILLYSIDCKNKKM